VDIYIIDTSSLIEMKERYPKKNFPTLWNKVEKLIQDERLITHIEVKKEIEKGDDELKEWIKKKNIKKMFIKPDKNQIEKVQEILKKYPFLAKADKPEEPNADPWLIALAIVKKEKEIRLVIGKRNNYIIVTEESSRKIHRIPRVCKEIGIECIKFIELVKREGWVF